MSSVPVLLFASYADAFGGRAVDVPIRRPCTVSQLVDAMRALAGGERLPAQPLVAVNHAYATPELLIREGDEVALIPPVAGG